MSVICVSGMIASGKSSISEILGEALGSEVYYENVDNNEILPIYYTASEEELSEKRIPFLLQLDFLDSRYREIKKAFNNNRNVLDRSIYEDSYFTQVNVELGKISDLEYKIYTKLVDNMMEELDSLPKKAPDLMVYLKGSFETIMERIEMRGRDFEQLSDEDEAVGQDLRDYYYKLWSGYDEWLAKYYDKSEVVTFNIDELDFVKNEEDADYVVKVVKDKLKEMGI